MIFFGNVTPIKTGCSIIVSLYCLVDYSFRELRRISFSRLACKNFFLIVIAKLRALGRDTHNDKLSSIIAEALKCSDDAREINLGTMTLGYLG